MSKVSANGETGPVCMYFTSMASPHIGLGVEDVGNKGIVEMKEEEALETSPQGVPPKEEGELQDVLEEAPSKKSSGKP